MSTCPAVMQIFQQSNNFFNPLLKFWVIKFSLFTDKTKLGHNVYSKDINLNQFKTNKMIYYKESNLFKMLPLWLQSHVHPQKRIKQYFQDLLWKTIFNYFWRIISLFKPIIQIEFWDIENTNHPSISENVFYRRISSFFSFEKRNNKKTKIIYSVWTIKV